MPDFLHSQPESNCLEEKRPLVSILINNYNYGCYLSQAIDSALAQTYTNVEVIVVDDGSQDNSQDILKNYSNQNIKIIIKPNGGQASAFNAGFFAASGDIVCFLDADDYFYPEKVMEIVALFQGNTTIGWIFHKLAYVTAEDEKLEVKDPSRYLTESQVVDFQNVLRQGKRFTHTIPCGLCFRKSLLSNILPMPESEGVTISDNYIKYSALFLSSGLLLTKQLAVQRIHSQNSYTFRDDRHKLRAEINIKLGFYLRQTFPQMHRFANKRFAEGCGEMLAEGGWLNLYAVSEFKHYLQQYRSLPTLAEIIPKTLLQIARFRLQKLKFSPSSSSRPTSD
ncbi:MAG: glycosyltransferase [Cyanobacteria bacterium P01_D01_bin.156]